MVLQLLLSLSFLVTIILIGMSNPNRCAMNTALPVKPGELNQLKRFNMQVIVLRYLFLLETT